MQITFKERYIQETEDLPTISGGIGQTETIHKPQQIQNDIQKDEQIKAPVDSASTNTKMNTGGGDMLKSVSSFNTNPTDTINDIVTKGSSIDSFAKRMQK